MHYRKCVWGERVYADALPANGLVYQTDLSLACRDPLVSGS